VVLWQKVAVLEGSDPVLKQEYVVIGAHYDAVGTEAGIGYAGADDNASGTVAVMAIAKAFAASERPKRSVVFMWYSGEEQGLWGSRFFVNNPTVPLDKIVTYVNLDMVGRSKTVDDKDGVTGPDEVYVLGPKLTSTDLTELVERVNRSYLNLHLNYLHDDLNDGERLIIW
jgi:Zn-dependent M28 family amino/carboxypeptidase